MTNSAKTGRVGAGGKIKARNIIVGVKMEGAVGDEVLQEAMQLARQLNSGDVTAKEGIEVEEDIVIGFYYLNPEQPTIEDFVAELKALRDELDQAIAASEIPSETKAKYARRALDEAAEMAEEKEPLKDILVGRIKEFLSIATQASKAFEAIDKAAPIIAKTVPTALALIQLAGRLF